MLLVDGVYMLANVIIVNFTQVDLVLWGTLSHGVLATIVVQMKDDLYYNQFLLDMFLLLIVKVFECLH